VLRSRLLLLALVLTAVLPVAPARGAVAVVVVSGRGHGHGVGMAQDGAYWMGQKGASMDDILGHFYPGTTRGSAKGVVRVVVLVTPDGRASLTFPDGGELRSPRSGPQRSGFPVRVRAGGHATITFDGTYRIEADTPVAAQSASVRQVIIPTSSSTSTSSTSTSSTTTTALLPFTPPSTSPPTTAPPAGSSSTTTTSTTAPPRAPRSITSPEPVWAGPVTNGATVAVDARGLRYRGELEVSAATGPLRVVNEIDVEQYLWGLGEVSASWSPAALRAQVVAARTYALRAMAANHEICDTQRCQVYKGASGEFRGQVDAVNATLGTALFYGGRFASTVFSANAAGTTATPNEGFGTPDASHPYLVAAPYETQSDVRYEVRIALDDLASRLHYGGHATSFTVAARGPSGRPVDVVIDGDAGAMHARAIDAAAAMGLQSTMWDARIEAADVAPVAPAAADVLQAAPDDVGRAVAAEQAAAIRRASRFDGADATTTTVAGGGGNEKSHGAVPWLLVVLVLVAGGAGVDVLRRTKTKD
jgi:SpoIID/LytB domain protein